jgi:hypothetical protein
MFFQILRSLLGPFVVILDFFILNPEILGIIISLYLITLGLGRLQIKRITSRTVELIIEKCSAWLKETPTLTGKQLFDRFYPVWVEGLKKFRFPLIMNKHDLWAVTVTPEHVLIKLPLSPEYINQTLINAGVIKEGSQMPATKRKSKK